MTAVVGYLDSFVPSSLDPKIKVKIMRKFNRPPYSREDQDVDVLIDREVEKWLIKMDFTEPVNL